MSQPNEPNPISRRSVTHASIGAALGLAFASRGGAQVATPTMAMTEDGLRDLEERRLRSLVDFDPATADELHAHDFQLINPSGIALSKEAYLGDLASGFVDYLIFEPASGIDVHLVLGAGILRYQSSLELVLGGSPIPKSTYWHTDYYEERDGRWQAVWSQATEVLA